MNVSIHDGDDYCWLCSMPESCCDCESFHSPWSKSTSQESFRTFDGHDERFDADEPASCTVDNNCFLASTFGLPDFEIDAISHPKRSGSQHLFAAASTPKNNDDVSKWESPGVMPPPESSSPIGFHAVASSTTWASCCEDPDVDQCLCCGPLEDKQWRIEVPFNCCVDSSFPIPPNTATMGSLFSVPAGRSTEESLKATERQAIYDDICAMTNQISKADLEILDPDRASASGHTVTAPRKKSLFSGPTILDLTTWTELEPGSSHFVENEESYGSTTTGSDNPSINVPSRGTSLISALYSTRTPMDHSLKRRRSSGEHSQESKKAKLEHSVSHISHASNPSVQFKYQATKPASLRRAESLKSEISACSEVSTDSLFGPPPTQPTSRPNEYPPTVPSTPLPNSVDYARSRANPLARTLAVYRRRSLDIPPIPPVPIIAPPSHAPSAVVRCAEDHAIDRLEALLLREHSEREMDGLHVYDEKRTEQLIAIHGNDLAFSRPGSASTSESSNNGGRWEEESTLSAIDSQESQQLSRSVKIQILSEQYRVANREIWTDAYGVEDDFRKEVTRWILETVPKDPVPVPEHESRDERPLGVDLYDQLLHSCQTRFHAAQLFHRYFLLPEKVEFWREARKYERFVSEKCESCGDPDYLRGVWDLAVACIALSVKLHRDCLNPLRPVLAAEFLEMAPYSMTHETLELAQRDILYSCQFQLGSCTPQDVLDELWNALPTLRKATAPVGWAVVQRVTWEKLFESLLEPDMLQHPVTLLTAAALVDGLAFALACQYKNEEEVNICKCKALYRAPEKCVLDEIEPMLWEIHLYEANQLVNDVILDVRDVLHISPMELDECRKWLSHVGQA